MKRIEVDGVHQIGHLCDSFSNIGKGKSDFIFPNVSKFSIPTLNETKEASTAFDVLVSVFLHRSDKSSHSLSGLILKVLTKNN